MRDVRVKISETESDAYIKKAIHAAVGKILNRCEKQFGAKYSDQTMLILYNKCEQFSKEIQEIVCAENMNPETDIFGTTPNFNYFSQLRLF